MKKNNIVKVGGFLLPLFCKISNFSIDHKPP
jgi:hypothetical protein